MVSVLTIILALLAPAQDAYTALELSADGFEVTARYYSPPYSGAPVIVVVHDWGETLDNWDAVARLFSGYGFAVITFALPGHSHGDNSRYYHADGAIADYLEAVDAACSYAGSRSRTVHLLGSGLGANLAMVYAAGNRLQGRVAALSPGLDYRGIVVEPEQLRSIAPRLMLIASQEDTYSTNSIQVFGKALTELSENEKPPVVLYSNAGHGIWILKRLAESRASTVRWFSEFQP